MLRRHLLAGAGAAIGASAIGAPALGQGTTGAARVLKFIPQADLAVLDPILTTAYVTRHHGYMIWDTLYGFDSDYKAQPQMVEGHTVEDDGKGLTEEGAKSETGLGAMIVKQLARQFGGQPRYEAREGGGTRVSVSLPELDRSTANP